MSIETQKYTSREQGGASSARLTRRGKVAAWALGAGLSAAVAVGAAHNYAQSENDIHPPTAGAFGQAAAEFGGSDTGWEYGTAETALRDALTEGVTKLYTQTQVGEGVQADMFEEKITETVDSLLTDEAIEQALEMAKGEFAGIPDPGDKLVFQVNVLVDTENNFSFTVARATIKDLPNNQD